MAKTVHRTAFNGFSKQLYCEGIRGNTESEFIQNSI